MPKTPSVRTNPEQARLESAVHQLEAAYAAIDAATDALAKAKADVQDLEENVLPEIMANMEADTVLVAGHPTEAIRLETSYHAHITQEHRDQAFTYLKATQREHMIKNQFIIQFGLREVDAAKSFQRMVERMFPDKPVRVVWEGQEEPDAFLASLQAVIDEAFSGHKLIVKQTVPGPTLKSWATMMLTAGKDWPADLFGAYQKRRAVLPWMKLKKDDSAADVLD